MPVSMPSALIGLLRLCTQSVTSSIFARHHLRHLSALLHLPANRFAQKESHFNLNSGLFYVAANLRTIELMERLETRLSRQKYWDQTAYNEEIFFLSHDNYRNPKVRASASVLLCLAA